MSFPVPPPSPTELVADPELLARGSLPGPAAAPAADLLVAAARDLAAALVLALPGAGPGHPPGGRSAPLAHALVEHWAVLAWAWADAVTEHRERLAGAATAFAGLDDDAAAVLLARRAPGP